MTVAQHYSKSPEEILEWDIEWFNKALTFLTEQRKQEQDASNKTSKTPSKGPKQDLWNWG